MPKICRRPCVRLGVTMEPIRKQLSRVWVEAIGAGFVLTLVVGMFGSYAQHAKYLSGKQWKEFLSLGEELSLFEHWNQMIQLRVDALAALAEAEGNEDSSPYLVTMVGDSTMMQQHGLVCAYLAEREGRRFDPAEHNDQCCVDTLSRANDSNAFEMIAKGNEGGNKAGGRGLCFRHAFQRYSKPPDRETLGEANAVYFGSGLHLLHMCRRGHGLESARVLGWLRYEIDLEDAVKMYRDGGGENFRLVFMTSHTIDDSRYNGEFQAVLTAYRENDRRTTSLCEHQVRAIAGDEKGIGEYTPGTYCRKALLARRGSDVLNERSRPVMARLGVALVEGDLIVKGQAWATLPEDGRHYHQMVPMEIFSLLGRLTSPYGTSPTN